MNKLLQQSKTMTIAVKNILMLMIHAQKIDWKYNKKNKQKPYEHRALRLFNREAYTLSSHLRAEQLALR